MRVASLFSGVGGIELGLEQAGHATDLLCESWPPARAVLAARFAHVELAGDVADLADLSSETALLTAGFPCQDLSQAGGARGIAGARSGLVRHVFRLLERRRRPLAALLENVPFMLRLDKGRAMATLTGAFEELGYRWAYRCVDALAFLPQRRRRVFFLASKGDLDPSDVLLVDEAEPPIRETDLARWAHGFYWTEGVRGLGWAIDSIPTLKNGSTIGIASPPAILLPDGAVITPEIRDAERLQGLPADWTAPAGAVARPSFRWSLVGNAVSAPVAAWIGARLKAPGRYESARDGAAIEAGGWPPAARGERGRRVAVRIGAFPGYRARPPLTDFLRHEGAPLSARATRGFLSRADRSALRFPRGFKERLRAHLERADAA